MDWLYRFTTNVQYPNPVEEIDTLCTLDGNDEPTFLLLAERTYPPLSRASGGEVVGLCTSEGNRLILHGTAVIAGNAIRGSTPSSMLPIYGNRERRVFCPLKDLERLPSEELPDAILSHEEQGKFLNGRSFVKRLTAGARTARGSAAICQPKASPLATKPTFPSLVFPQRPQGFTVVGLDPTAGTWASKMAEGPKEMPSFSLRWDGSCFRPDVQPLAWHTTNNGFKAEVSRRHAVLICIDGPCGTNGPKLLPDLSGWDRQGGNGTRGGELALSRLGVNLFWTTQNTVMKFEGASRWIARSLVLFSERQGPPNIETHPHGAFSFFWQLFGETGTPPKKSKPSGRLARMSLLRSFIPALSDEMVPNHDALDAACAALVAGLHHLGLTIPFGTTMDGGQIWMPDIAKLADILASN